MKKYFLIMVLVLIMASSAWGQMAGNATRIQNRPVSQTAPTAGQAMCWDDTSKIWKPCATSDLGLEIGADVQAYSANLDTFSGIAPSADVQTMLGSTNNADILSKIGAVPAASAKTDNTDGSVGGPTIPVVASDNHIEELTLPGWLELTGTTDPALAIKSSALVIDAHAASTTITLYPHKCAIIHNKSQADSNISNTLPAVSDGSCFIAQVVTTEDDKNWRLVAASANTICLDGTCSKDDVGFTGGQVTKGNFFTCFGLDGEWYCETGRGTANAGDL